MQIQDSELDLFDDEVQSEYINFLFWPEKQPQRVVGHVIGIERSDSLMFSQDVDYHTETMNRPSDALIKLSTQISKISFYIRDHSEPSFTDVQSF